MRSTRNRDAKTLTAGGMSWSRERSVPQGTGSRRWRTGLLAVTLLGALAISLAAAPSPLRIALIAGHGPEPGGGRAHFAALKQTLEARFGAEVGLIVPTEPSSGPALSLLPTCDAALLYGGPGEFAASDAASLRGFLESGRGLVVVPAASASWAAWDGYEREVLGAAAKGRFAEGAPMRIINLFPHEIFTGVARLDSRQPMPLFADLAADAQVIMEGTVGEATTPLAWLRRLGPSRVCTIVPAEPALFRDDAYLQLLGNALLWTARRPIPGARAIVQRTYLPDAYPGAFAVTLPGGPAFSLDPVRGGISQVWDGDYVNLRPRWITKQGEPAQIGGDAFFRDSGRELFWVGPGAEDPPFRFKGYSLAGPFPEFYYRVGDRDVTEETRPTESGFGLVRRFRVSAGSTPLRYKIDSPAGAEIITRGIQPDDRGLAFSSPAAGEFSIEIRPRKIVSP